MSSHTTLMCLCCCCARRDEHQRPPAADPDFLQPEFGGRWLVRRSGIDWGRLLPPVPHRRNWNALVVFTKAPDRYTSVRSLMALEAHSKGCTDFCTTPWSKNVPFYFAITLSKVRSRQKQTLLAFDVLLRKFNLSWTVNFKLACY